MTSSLGNLTGKWLKVCGGWRWPVLMTWLVKVTEQIHSHLAHRKSIHVYLHRNRRGDNIHENKWKWICTSGRGFWKQTEWKDQHWRLDYCCGHLPTMCVPVCFASFLSIIHHYNWCHGTLVIGKTYSEPLKFLNNGGPASYISHLTSFSTRSFAALRLSSTYQSWASDGRS